MTEDNRPRTDELERWRQEREKEARRVNKLLEARNVCADAVEHLSAKDIRRLAYTKQISPEFAHFLVHEFKHKG